MPLSTSAPEVIHEQGLHHQLTAGQMTMVAVGGSIGTGLLLGSAAALEVAGPGVILSYVIAAFIAYTVAMALGELASTHPAAGSFGLYGELYLNQYLGFLCRAAYWAAIAFSIGAELVASATYMGYWFPAVPAEIWVILFASLLVLVNLRNVGSFGRFEFWFSMMPWNHPGVSESPFVSVLRLAKVPAAAYFMNFVVLTAALSGANAKLYVASRLLFSMGRTGWAPAQLGKLNASGSPRWALLVSSYGIVTALIIENWAPKQAFLYIMGAAFSGLIFSWIVSLAAHISFRWRLTPELVAKLPMRSPLGIWGSIVGFVLVPVAVLHPLFATSVNEIGGFAFFAVLSVAYLLLKRRRQAAS